MFHLDGIVFIAVLCVAKAAITVNIYDDELKEDIKSGMCDSQICNQLCQRKGYSGGICLLNRCICNKFLQTEELEEGIMDNKLHACNNRACNQLCLRLGFTGGVCVGDKCKCDNFLRTEELEESIKDNKLHACNNRACNQLCLRLGFTGGVCVGDKCKCDNFLRTEGRERTWSPVLTQREDPSIKQATHSRSELQEHITDNNLGGCNNQACNFLCRILGYSWGECENGNCKCVRSLQSEVADTSIFEEGSNDILERSANSEESSKCNKAACVVACLELGYPSGSCQNGYCQCDPKVQENVMARYLRSCDVVACNNMCHRINYIGGMCRSGMCYCY